MCSTNDHQEAIHAAVQAGCDMFLVKPFQLDILLTLAKTINRASLRAAPKVQIIDNTALPRWEARPEPGSVLTTPKVSRQTGTSKGL